MTSTYETLAEFARSGGTIYCFALFLGVLVYAFWPANRRSFQEGGRSRRCARIERWRRTTRSKSISITGQTTTGHEWDGISELNTPLPRWWLWTFYATILFAIGYWVLYPAWPRLTGFTHGLLGQSSRGDVAADVAGDPGAARADRGRPRQGERGRHRRRQEAAGPRAGARQGGLRRELRALPRRRRPGRQGLPQPDQRRLAVGRQRSRTSSDDHPRHPRLCRQGHAPERDAGLRQRRASSSRRRFARSPATCAR